MQAIWKHVHDVAEITPNSSALVHDQVSLDYGTLAALVDSVAFALRNVGLNGGDVMAMVADKHIDSVCLILAAMQIGAIFVPINPLLKAAQIVHILNDSGSKLLFADIRKINTIVNHSTVLPILETAVITRSAYDIRPNEIIDNTAQFGKPNISFNTISWSVFTEELKVGTDSVTSDQNLDSTAAIIYTSGSTGIPRGVEISHANLAYGAESVSRYLGNNPQDRILALMPLSFDYGLSQLITSIYSGACLVLHNYGLPKGVINAVERHQITGIPAVPHVWNQLARLDWPDLPALRYITNTGGRFDRSTIEALKNRLPKTRIFSMYGFTEAFRATYLDPDELATRPDSIGKAVPNAKILIVDNNGHQQPPYTTGELIQTGPLVSKGYWKDPESSKIKFRGRYNADNDNADIYAWSGDLAYTDDDGFIYFVSRKDDQIKINGYRITPSEIEKAFVHCEKVSEVSVLCFPDERSGYKIVAFIVAKEIEDEEWLFNWCNNNVPNFMVPHQIIFVQYLPTTSNNKIDKEQLVGIYRDQIDSSNNATRSHEE